MTPRLLDLFCCAGGATRGYQRAGFHVTGVDLNPQPNYCGDEFTQGDAVQFVRAHGHEFDAIHASPPCQSYSGMSNCRPGLSEEYPQLIDVMRDELAQIGGPWVIENVDGSGLPTQDDLMGAYGVELCGAMFGLALYRHRLFETSFPIPTPPHPRHLIPASKAGHWEPGTVISVAGNCSPIAVARQAMGIDWTNRGELAESIPPAYTEFIGEQLLAHLAEAAA
jgi:DNA (cytosine-5)-methyltransferase 1